MNVKLSTKEKFTVIEVLEPYFAANMTAEFQELAEKLSSEAPHHIILDLGSVQVIETDMAEQVAQVQADSYEKGHSFVVCGMDQQVQKTLENADLIDVMNITPTQSEAWDIVQMEEVERELLKDFDIEDEE